MPPLRLAEAADSSALTAADRRAHQRFGADALWWLRSCRFKYGKPVSVVDLSAGGALLETPFQLRPGSNHVLELAGSEGLTLALTEVLRCEISRLSGSNLYYHGACVFKRPLTIPGLQAPRDGAPTPLDVHLRNFVSGYAARGLQASTAHDVVKEAQELIDILERFRQRVVKRPSNKFELLIAGVIEEAIAVLQKRSRWRDAQDLLADRLRHQLPQLELRVVQDPISASKGVESFHIAIDRLDTGDEQFLNVGIPHDYALDETDFRLLKTTAELMRLVRAWDERRLSVMTSADLDAEGLAGDPEPVSQPEMLSTDSAPAATANTEGLPRGWNRIVIRYLDGQLIRGFSGDFHPSNKQFSVWPNLSAQPDECRVVHLSRLKAVFFVKDFEGDPSYQERKTFDAPPRGRKLEITFLDGEVMVGSTMSYQPGGSGFFLLPADPRSNNLRAFIVNGSTRHVRFI